ncbi:MAG TPA: GNAT family N-acetyltransferase [Acidimicrobiales bacterium]|jgi:GNAT superfamily N-acetyltransferase|nr:GNAT family N-acetyltransferase [Acidimicrobiales bacterium]
MESVRVAGLDDDSRLVQLCAELVAGVSAQRGGPLLIDPALDEPTGAALAGRLRPLFDRPDGLVLVGMLDGVVVGFAVSTIEEMAGRSRRGILGACYVEPGARGVGVGRLLLDRSLSWFEDHGCDGVDGTALPGDRGAKNFYESAGFRARLLTMHRPLG